MLNNYLSDRVLSYLVTCNNCKNYHLDNSNNRCCICKKFFCNNCLKYFHSYYGFYENSYCKSCFEFIN